MTSTAIIRHHPTRSGVTLRGGLVLACTGVLAAVLLRVTPTVADVGSALDRVADAQTAGVTPPSAAVATLLLVTVCGVAWAVVAVLLWSALLTLLSHGPERLARFVRLVSSRTVPRALRQLLGLGVGVVIASGVPGLSATAYAQASETGHSSAPSSSQAEAATGAIHQPPVDWPGMADGASQEASDVTVRPGDSLWRIAARELPTDSAPAEIDSRWREWHETNQQVIGPDPDLIHPGQVLTSPARSA